MSQAAKAQEPSMEEILASIRRIIADDDGGGKAAKAAAPAPVKAAPPRRHRRHHRSRSPTPRTTSTRCWPTWSSRKRRSLHRRRQPLPSPNRNPEPPEPAADVLVLTEDMAAQPEPPPQQPAGFRTIEGSSDIVFSEAAGDRNTVDEARRQFNESAGDQLLSNTTAAAVDNAFNSLANTILGNNARTLEDLVKDMLRPMLKTWLDDNLPGLVERIVRAEIERVSRGR